MRYGKICILLVVASMVFLFAGQSFSHPASRVELVYDREDSVLEVVVAHSVSDPLSHYIDKFEVRLNGQKFCELELERQISSSDTMALFKLPPLDAGTEIEVEVYCNKF
nr:thiosulfate oxidation carrier complex protein SoxZ [Synergistales bacterium]